MLYKLRKFVENAVFDSPKRVLGLDIGDASVKMAEVSWQQDNPVVEQIAVAELPPGAVNKGQIMDRESVAGVVRGIKDKYGVRAVDTVAAVGRKAVFLREMNVPTNDAAMLKQILKFEVAEQVPYAKDTYYFDFVVVEPQDQQNRALIVASPAKAVDAVCDVIDQAGLQLMAIEAEPLAWRRLLSTSGGVLAVDIGEEYTGMFHFAGGRLSFSRSVALGCASIKASKGFAELTGEILRTVRFVAGKGENLKTLVIGGEGANIPGLVQVLTEESKISTHVIDPLAAVKISTSFEPYNAWLHRLPVAVGLAMRPRGGGWQ